MNYAPEIRVKRYPIRDYTCTLNACEKMLKITAGITHSMYFCL